MSKFNFIVDNKQTEPTVRFVNEHPPLQYVSIYILLSQSGCQIVVIMYVSKILHVGLKCMSVTCNKLLYIYNVYT